MDSNGKNTPAGRPPSSFIDNTGLKYIPVQLRCGVLVRCRPDVMALCPQILRDLNSDLLACLQVLPQSVHALVKRTTIWINTTYYYGPRQKPKNVNHSTAHHHEGWLLWVRDNPEKAKGIEIYNCFDYRAMRFHWQGCGLILHELCHLMHQIVLEDGLENMTVKNAYEQAKNSGLYNKSLRRDWAGMPCDEDMAYAMVNYKEFFAELSVTFLSDAYRELDEENGTCMEKCSPPILAPTVLKRIHESSSAYGTRRSENISIGGMFIEPSAVIGEESSRTVQNTRNQSFPLERRATQGLPHCNKFFPFTKGQFKNHDPDTYETFARLWSEIRDWDDSNDQGKCFTCC